MQEYSSKELKGLKVEHDQQTFKEGQTVILTLKDKGGSRQNYIFRCHRFFALYCGSFTCCKFMLTALCVTVFDVIGIKVKYCM
jgi:hypothetical protein